MKKKSALLFVLGLTAGCLPTIAQAESSDASQSAVPVLSVESHLRGSAYTNGKSTLKYHLHTDVSYADDSNAVFTLTMPDGSEIDDSKIDCSSASVSLSQGDGYYSSEYVLLAAALDGEWQDGQYIYTLSDGDFELNLDQYPLVDLDSGREWSCLGGDGAGNYHFNLTVSGIVYDGEMVEAQTFPLDISVYGYNYSEDAINLYGETGTPPISPEFASLEEKADVSVPSSAQPVWTWIGAGDIPILCDHLADDFYITWDADSDASGLTSSDITVILTGQYGDMLILEPEKDYFVQSSRTETQIALTYQNWAFTPVYTSMTIEVNGEHASASETFDIASVYVYEAQQGGGGQTVDGTVTAYSFYGLANLESWEQLMSPAIYLLTCEQDGVIMYYTQEKDGTPSLTDDITKAFQFDASGPEERNQQLIGNTLYITARRDMREIEKTIGDETISFTQLYPGRDSGVNGGGSLLSPSDCDQSLQPEAGYAIPWGTDNWITNEKWAWQTGVEQGWTGISITPYTGKFEWEIPLGSSEQFSASLNGEDVDVIWQIVGDTDEGTSVSENGLVTVSETESHSSFAVTAADQEGRLGTVTIKVASPE